MLQMRFLRSGRKNKAFFRIVLTEHSKPPQSGFKKVLGWYNPHTKESSLDKEEILYWLDNGAKPTNSLSRLLESKKIKHKLIKFIPSKKKAKKKEEEPDQTPKKEAPQEKPEEPKEKADKEEPVNKDNDSEKQIEKKPEENK